jgi:ubiquitin carboxyl-terminal hydrolase 25/28
VYIYDHKKEIWRKYNDDRVTIVDNRNEIFGAPVLDQWGSPPPNPYLLVYVKAESVNDIVETVKRDIVYPPPDGPPPVPARDQISAMPPTQSQGDVEMVEYVNGGEQAQDPFPDIDMKLSHSQPLLQKEGQWNDSELTADRKIKW